MSAWQVARDERVRRSVAPALALLEQHGWRELGLLWERLRGHRFLIQRPSGATEYVSADQVPALAEWVAKGGGV